MIPRQRRFALANQATNPPKVETKRNETPDASPRRFIIGIDASKAVKAQPTGTELYCARLIGYLAKIDNENTYYLYTPVAPPDTFAKLPDNFHWKVIPFTRLWTHIRLALALMLDRPNLVFIPAHVMPLFCFVPAVVTIHDVAGEVFPEAYSAFARWYGRFSTRLALRKAKAILTPSKATKNDLVKIYQADPEKITVTALGVDQIGKIEISKKVTEAKPFFLMLGRLETRKNTARVIEAYKKFREANPENTQKLILIGKPGYGYEQVQTTLKSLPEHIAADIIELGYQDDATAKAYLKAADAFIYPSLYEGFGLAALEAMTIGTPVITSDISSLPEVVGDAAILVDPQSSDEIAGAMKLLATNDLTKVQLSKKGKEQAKLFSWEKTATETLNVLEYAYEKRT